MHLKVDLLGNGRGFSQKWFVLREFFELGVELNIAVCSVLVQGTIFEVLGRTLLEVWEESDILDELGYSHYLWRMHCQPDTFIKRLIKLPTQDDIDIKFRSYVLFWFLINKKTSLHRKRFQDVVVRILEFFLNNYLEIWILLWNNRFYRSGWLVLIMKIQEYREVSEFEKLMSEFLGCVLHDHLAPVTVCSVSNQFLKKDSDSKFSWMRRAIGVFVPDIDISYPNL